MDQAMEILYTHEPMQEDQPDPKTVEQSTHAQPSMTYSTLEATKTKSCIPKSEE
jgi:hypothetical protein